MPDMNLPDGHSLTRMVVLWRKPVEILMMSRIRYWLNIRKSEEGRTLLGTGLVAGYETFCEACAEPDADADDVQMMSDSLMREISMTEGIMSPQQRRRIEVALDRYRERRRAL